MTMNATRLGDAIVDGMKTVSTFSATQEAASRNNMIKLAQAVIDEIEDYHSGGGGTSDHAALTSLGWGASGHTKGATTGAITHVAGWASGGAATAAALGTDITAASVGADASGTAASAITTHLGAAPHVALSSSTPQPLGTAAAGSTGASSDAGHVHGMPTAANVGALALDGTNSPTAHLNLGGYRITNAGAATSGSDLTTLDQVNGLLEGRSFADPVISATTGTPPGSPTTGDRYIVPVGAGGAWTSLVDLIVEWDGATWDTQTPAEGWTVAVQDTGTFLRYNDAYPAGDWTNLGSAVDHAALINRAWAASGHTGTASRLAGFDGTGAATYFQIGVDVQAYDSDLAAVAAGTWAGATSITTLGDVTTCTALAAGSSAAISVAGTPISWKVRASGTGGSLLAAEFAGSRINSTHPGVSMVTAAARASGASPAALSSGDPLWEHYAAGYDGSGYFAGARARVVAAAAPSSGVIPTKWEWYTTSVGGATLVQATLDSANGLTLTAPLAIASGGHGQTTASAGFDALKQTGTTTSAGVFEVATQAEYAAGKVMTTDDLRVVYSYPKWAVGHRTASKFGSGGGTGLLAGTLYNTAPVRDIIANIPVDRWTGTTTERGWYDGGAGDFTFDQRAGWRGICQFAMSSSSNFRGYFGLVASGAGAVTYTATTRRIQIGVENGTWRWILADGTTPNNGTFGTATFSVDTVYTLEIIVGSSDVTFKIWNADQTTLIDSTTQSSNQPTGATGAIWATGFIAPSGSPLAYLGWVAVRYQP